MGHYQPADPPPTNDEPIVGHRYGRTPEGHEVTARTRCGRRLGPAHWVVSIMRDDIEWCPTCWPADGDHWD